MRDNAPLFTALVALALGATLIIVVLSAYIRLDNAGAGCAPWPACYGQRKAETSAFTPGTGASVTHRIVASALALLVMLIAFAATRRPRKLSRVALAWLALLLTIFLAVLGVYTPGATVPAVTIGNLLGGFVLLSALWWLYLDLRPLPRLMGGGSGLRGAMVANLALSLAAVLAGAVAAAYLAGGSCTVGCAWLPDLSMLRGLDLFAPLPSVETETHERISSQLYALHRLLGALTAVVVLATAWHYRRTLRRTAIVLMALVLAQVALGLAQIKLGMPLSLAVGHNAVAGLLLLVLIAGAHRLRAG